MLDVNLFGALHVMQAAVKHMRRQANGGHIVNVGSLAGRRGFSPLGGYSATKFALVGMTEALRTELADEKIGVSLVLPGVVDTPMAETIASDPANSGFWPRKLNMPARVGGVGDLRRRTAQARGGRGAAGRCADRENWRRSTPGATDVLVRSVMSLARRTGRTPTSLTAPRHNTRHCSR